MIEQLANIGIGPIMISLMMIGFIGVAIYKGQKAKKSESKAVISQVETTGPVINKELLSEIIDEKSDSDSSLKSENVDFEKVKAVDLGNESVIVSSDDEMNMEEECVLVAIITASIAASLNKNSDRIVVKSLRRVQPTNRW